MSKEEHKSRLEVLLIKMGWSPEAREVIVGSPLVRAIEDTQKKDNECRGSEVISFGLA